MNADRDGSPAAKVMNEAIDLAIAGRSPYPEKAAFIDADTPTLVTRFNARPTKDARLSSSPQMAAVAFSSLS